MEQAHIEHVALNGNSIPDGQKIGTYKNREEVNQAVARLSEAGVPVQGLFIVGNNIRQVELIAGKMTYPKAALSGAVSGAVFGGFISVIMALVTNTSFLANALTAIPLGIAFWMLSGVLSVSRNKNRGSFITKPQMIAESYDLMAVGPIAHQARQALGVPGFGAPQQPVLPHNFDAHNNSAPHNNGAAQNNVSQEPHHQDRASGPGYPQWQRPQNPNSQHPNPQHPTSQPQKHNQPGPWNTNPQGLGNQEHHGSYSAGNQQPYSAEQERQSAEFAPPTAAEGSASKFGLRVDNPEEYEAMIRQAPTSPETNPVVEAVRNEKPLQKYGKRVEDPEEYEATIRKPEDHQR